MNPRVVRRPEVMAVEMDSFVLEKTSGHMCAYEPDSNEYVFWLKKNPNRVAAFDAAKYDEMLATARRIATNPPGAETP